ncbi:sulfurtransferase [Thiohalomonas denitrificans]|uniref:sulfurtransferase n=1 Tax=Thiohalomonas denitrificans TaxID=415747 RepID=UPI0026EA5EA0|nr:sulfurtransferase [Thiohalomonas denitrificans]
MMRNQTSSQFGRYRIPAIGLSLTLAMGLSACGGSEDETYTSNTTDRVVQATPATIAQESADNYDNNVNGLITGNTLKSWIDNWEGNRPSGIDGKLVILQTGSGEAGYEFIKPNGTNVFTYQASEWDESRSNGVIETRSMVPSGRSMDTFLAKYGIDPAEDMIICAQGTAGAGQSMRAGRCWYMFRYWGTPKEHLAVLNGGNQWNGEGDNTALDVSYFAVAGSTPPMNGTASVKDLPEINFALQATLEDMMNVVPSQDANLLGDGVFIWDARGNNLPTSLDSSGVPADGVDYIAGKKGDSDEYSPNDDYDFRNYGATQGHPNGALLLAYSNIADGTEGWTFKSKSEIQAYLNGQPDVDDNQFVDGTLQGVGAGRAYQEGDTIYTYCETTYRAMVTGFASAAILGLPTRFYDGAMYEWHSMANVVAVSSDGDTILPWDSPWRTDKSEWSMFRTASDPANVAPRAIVNAYASSANAIINEDLAYKGITVDDGGDTGTDSDDGGSSGGGVEMPTNSCG